jgi:hypothetical protein
MKPGITVYTSITDEKDTLLDNQLLGEAQYVAFTDLAYVQPWQIKKPYDRFVDPRRNSRIQKILAHQFIETEYSIYIDGNIRLLVPPEELIAEHLKDTDLAVWRHPKRDCVFDEAIVCAKRKLDDPETIIEQAVAYEKDSYAKHKGLAECNVILRRHTKKVEEFNNAWWSEYCRHSRRDQISFMYAVDKVGLRIKLIDDPFLMVQGKDMAVRTSGALEIYPHKKLNL